AIRRAVRTRFSDAWLSRMDHSVNEISCGPRPFVATNNTAIRASAERRVSATTFARSLERATHSLHHFVVASTHRRHAQPRPSAAFRASTIRWAHTSVWG